MARIPRMLVAGDPTAYHIISRTALNGFPLQDVEKDFFIKLLKNLSSLYLADILGFCIMGNHFHLLIRMWPENEFSDEEIKTRYEEFYGKDRGLEAGQIPYLRQKLSSLSEFIREIKLGFTRFYNKRHHRRGYFWGDRFKSLIIENGETLINCLAYIDLNPVRAGLVQRPEEYRWGSIGYHIQTNNKDDFLSLDFGLNEYGVSAADERLRRYREFLYETGAIDRGKRVQLDPDIVEKERKSGYELKRVQRFKYRTRYFTDSGIIGSKVFVSNTYQIFKEGLQAKREKTPKPVSGLDGIYSLKRLAV